MLKEGWNARKEKAVGGRTSEEKYTSGLISGDCTRRGEK